MTENPEQTQPEDILGDSAPERKHTKVNEADPPAHEPPAGTLGSTDPTEDSDRDPGIQWKRLLADTGVIIFSVLFALVLDDWRSSKDQREVIESVLSSLAVELNNNQHELELLLPYHKALKERLLASTAPDSLDELPSFPKELSEGSTFGPLLEGAWQAALASDVVSTMSTKRVYFLSTSYSMQEDLQGLLSRLVAYEDRYLENRAQDSIRLSSTKSYIRALDRTIRAEESLCEQYRLVTEDFTGREVSSEGQCGGGAFVVS